MDCAKRIVLALACNGMGPDVMRQCRDQAPLTAMCRQAIPRE